MQRLDAEFVRFEPAEWNRDDHVVEEVFLVVLSSYANPGGRDISRFNGLHNGL